MSSRHPLGSGHLRGHIQTGQEADCSGGGRQDHPGGRSRMEKGSRPDRRAPDQSTQGATMQGETHRGVGAPGPDSDTPHNARRRAPGVRTFETREGREATLTTINFQPRPRPFLRSISRHHQPPRGQLFSVPAAQAQLRPSSGPGEWIRVYALRPPDPESGQQGDKPSGSRR